jgi:ABC-2 type transport system permease protein
MLLTSRYALIKNERLKTYKKPSTWVLMGIIVLMTLLDLVFTKLIYSSYNFIQTSWQEQYGYSLEGYKAQLNQNPDDEHTKMLIEWTEYLLDNEIPPQDWRTDVVVELIGLKSNQQQTDPGVKFNGSDVYEYEYRVPMPGAGGGLNLSEEQRAERLDRLERILEDNDWKAYVNLKIEDIKNGYMDSGNPQEKQVNIEMYETYLKENIVPTAQNMHFLYHGDMSLSLIWKSREIESIKENKLSLLRGENRYGEMLTKSMRRDVQQDIDISLKRLATDTPPIESDSFLAQLENASDSIVLFSILLIVYSALVFASEYSGGTIKLLLVTPHRRSKVFWAKIYLLFELMVIAVVANFIIAFLVSGLPASFEGIGTMQVFAMFGFIFRTPYLLYIAVKYALMLLPILAYGALSVMLSIVTKRSSVAIAVTLMLVFGSPIIMALIAFARSQFIIPGIKFLLFSNIDLASYLTSRDMITVVDTTMTLEFSIAVLLVYMLCFMWIARDSFCRRDVK